MDNKTFYVVRVDGDSNDTHAAECLARALDIAMPDHGSRVEYAKVLASDAGAARIARIRNWTLVTSEVK